MSYSEYRRDELRNQSEGFDVSNAVELTPASVWIVEDEDDEMTLPGRRMSVPVKVQEFTAATINEPKPVEKRVAQPIRVLDESSVLPSEASYATVRLNQPIKSFDRDEPKPKANSLKLKEELKEERRPPLRVLDESAVLPSEASFATVKLNQPVESFKRDEPKPPARLEERPRRQPDRPKRVIDDSWELPDEASFPIAMLVNSNRSHSAFAEFSAKSIKWKTWALAALFVTSMFGIVAVVVMNLRVGAESSPQIARNRPESQPATEAPVQEPEVIELEPVASAGVTGQIEVSQPAVTVSEAGVTASEDPEASRESTTLLPLRSAGAPDDNLSVATEEKRKAAIDEANVKVTPNASPGSKAREANRSSAHSRVKRSDRVAGQSKAERAEARFAEFLRRHGVRHERKVKKKHPSHEHKEVTIAKYEVTSSRPKGESSNSDLGKKEPVVQAKSEERKPPATGGGERPRFVTRRNP